MEKVSKINSEIFPIICFLIVGILSIFDKKYITGILFIILTIAYIIVLISENKKEKIKFKK